MHVCACVDCSVKMARRAKIARPRHVGIEGGPNSLDRSGGIRRLNPGPCEAHSLGREPGQAGYFSDVLEKIRKVIGAAQGCIGLVKVDLYFLSLAMPWV